MWTEGRRYLLWWSGKGDEVGGVWAMVKEDRCEKVGEIIRVSDGVMAVMLVFVEDVLRLICGVAPQSGRSLEEKLSFYERCVGHALCRIVSPHVTVSHGHFDQCACELWINCCLQELCKASNSAWK